MSKLLSLLELRGQTWCYVDIKSPGGFSIPLNTDVLFYAVLQGRARVDGVSGGLIDLQVGDVVMILSGDAHTVRDGPAAQCAPGNPPWRPDRPVQTLKFLCEEQHIDVPPTIGIGQRGPVVSRLLCGRLTIDWPRALPRNSIPATVVLNADALDSTTSLLRVDALQSAGAGVGAATLLTRLASLMLAAGLRTHPQAALLFRSASKDSISQALRLIAADPAAPWSVARLARKVGMGRSSFAARFTAEVGQAPMELIAEQRMQYAAKLLREGDLKIAEISSRVGYSSDGSFSRRFTQHFGVSPSAMRENARKARTAKAQSPWISLLAGPSAASGSGAQIPHRPLAMRRT